MEELAAGKHAQLQIFGSEGKGEGQLSGPQGLAIDGSGNVWVADTGNNRIEEFSSAGKLVRTVTAGVLGPFVGPKALAFDKEGHLWVTDTGYGLIEEFSSTGSYMTYFGAPGFGEGQFKKPGGLAIDSTGAIWVADTGNNRIQRWPANHKAVEATFGSEGSGHGQFKAPRGVLVDASGNVWVADTANNRVQETTGAGKYLGELGVEGLGEGEFKSPTYAALDGSGNVWVSDANGDRVQEFSATGAYIGVLGSEGSGEGQLSAPHGVAVDKAGDVWVADTNNSRVEEFASGGKYLSSFAVKGVYGLALDASGNVWVTQITSSRVEEYTSAGKLIQAFASEGSGEGQLKSPHEITFDASGNVWVADTGNNRVQEFTAAGKYLASIGSEGSGEGQLKAPRGVAVDTGGDVWVSDTGNNRLVEFGPKGEYLGKSGSYGSGTEQMNSPSALVRSTGGSLYITDTANGRVQEWAPTSSDAHATQTVYYTAQANVRTPECGGHPEWEGLPCETRPAKQPETAGLPSLPVTTVAYNMWDQPETITETFPKNASFAEAKRIRKTTFDGAGRPLTAEVSASTGQAMPGAVTDKYNKATGALEEESMSTGGKTETLTTVYNTLGQLVEYVDADGNKTSYEYDLDGRPLKVNTTRDQQAYAYDKTTGALSELKDAQAGVFTASYDEAGRMTSETYPNGMTASYTTNPAGQTTGLEYQKTTHCTTGCKWFTDSVSPSIHGETLTQASSAAGEAYTYDAAGRLTGVEETPATESNCKNREYVYDEDSNRLRLTAYADNKSGACSRTEGSSSEAHTYDAADRLADTGVSYEPLGDISALPAKDAGGHELTSSYYADGQVYQTSQDGVFSEYKLDPEGRTREAITKTTGEVTTVSHYSGPGDALTWTSESGGNTTCNIPGIDGTIAAIQTNTSAPSIQIHDLQGDIVATAEDNGETETKPSSLHQSTEYGVPTEEHPPKYTWLGALGISSEIPATGTITTDGKVYVPQLGSGIQTGNVPPPIPTNAMNPVKSAISSGMIDGAAAWAAELDAAAIAAHEAAMRAAAPPGVEGEPGNGPGEETFGDPIHCYVGGMIVTSGEKGRLFGTGNCNQGLPEGTWIKVCIGALPDESPTFSDVNCAQIVVEHHQSRKWSIPVSAGVHCEEGELLRGYVAFWVPGGSKTMYGVFDGVNGSQGECVGSGDDVAEFGIGLWPQADLPSDLASLWYIFAAGE